MLVDLKCGLSQGVKTSSHLIIHFRFSRDEISIEIERNCRWYAQLIMYELNYVYMIWYDEPPSFLRLDADLRSYLEQNQHNYFQRLRKIETGSWL